MVASEILLKIPYIIARRLVSLFRKHKEIHFFATEELDYLVFRNVHKHLPSVKIVSKSKKLQGLLREKYGIATLLYPTFPDVIITARHCLHYYPDSGLIKIGMRHGPYHFKDFISAKQYNRFDLFLLTSPTEVQQAEAIGIKSAKSGGFPKADSLFEEKYSNRKALKFNNFANDKPVILFSSTWNNSGISGVHFWYDKLESLADDYNVLVTLHPWVDESFKSKIRSTRGVKYIESSDLTEYLIMADVLVSDTSSIIAEYILLDKPIITFKIPQQGRLSQEIIDMLENSTYRISDFSEISDTIKTALQAHSSHSEQRKYYAEMMFAGNLGNHGEFAANEISNFLTDRGLNSD